jgi:hypothetical protein
MEQTTILSLLLQHLTIPATIKTKLFQSQAASEQYHSGDELINNH